MSVCCVHADVSCEQWMWEKKKSLRTEISKKSIWGKEGYLNFKEKQRCRNFTLRCLLLLKIIFFCVDFEKQIAVMFWETKGDNQYLKMQCFI